MSIRAILAFSWVLCSCGATNTTRVSYAAELAKCISNERVILERTGTTETQDRRDLAAERARCDAELARIEEQ